MVIVFNIKNTFGIYIPAIVITNPKKLHIAEPKCQPPKMADTISNGIPNPTDKMSKRLRLTIT